MNKKIVVVGGVAGGASFAARMRRNDENAEITIVERGEYISFANCGLPYHIGGIIEEEEKLLVQSVEGMQERFHITVKNFTEAISIDRKAQSITLKHVKTAEETVLEYDYLVLSPGAAAVIPPFPGVRCQNIFTLRNIPDTKAIRDYARQNDVKHAVVVGGGFIGLEMAENLIHLGKEVSLVELSPQVMAPFDGDMADLLHEHIRHKGVDLRLKTGVKSFLTDKDQRKDSQIPEEAHKYEKYSGKHHKKDVDKKEKEAEIPLCQAVALDNGNEIETDMVILSIGIKPETEIAKAAGLEVSSKNGAILTDETMKTSDSRIYALGDAVEIKNFQTGQPGYVPLAGPANKQGRIVANILSGQEDRYGGTLGSAVAKIFDMTAASAGLNEKSLKAQNISYEKSFTVSLSHAGYYPGAMPITIKLLFEKPSGKVLGIQAAGYEGVEKRVDVTAAALYTGMTVYDLTRLELCYAPPYGSAKDPVNMAGYVAENILKDRMKVIHWHDIAGLDLSRTQLVDVRTPEEFEIGSIPGAVNIELDQIRERFHDLDPEKETVVFCRIGLRGYIASRILEQNGFGFVKNLSGGYHIWHITTGTSGALASYWGKDDHIPQEHSLESSPDEMNENDIEEARNNAVKLNAVGLQCPGPIMKTSQALKTLNETETVLVTASDPGFASDIKVWCQRTGNTLLDFKEEGKEIRALIQKGGQGDFSAAKTGRPDRLTQKENAKTMVVFSGDLDKALASFVIANGAASMGKKVTMFFTFWGINIIRKPDAVKVKKNIIEKMFGFMMPRGSGKLKLSKMHMGGIGASMIKGIMKKKNIDSLETMIRNAKEQGVRMIACNMSMDLMGIKKEELLDGVELGGVATFIGTTDEADSALFI